MKPYLLLSTTLSVFLFLTGLYLTAQPPGWLWAQSVGGSLRDEGNAIAADASGNIFATGYFESPFIAFGTTLLVNTGEADLFLVKYDPEGNVIWAISAGGSASDIGESLATDADGNIFLTGAFSSPTLTLGTYTLSNAGEFDLFIAKFDPEGSVLWAQSIGAEDFDASTDIAVDGDGNLLLTGFFQSSSLPFGSTVLQNITGNADPFVAKFGSNGELLWAQAAGESPIGYPCGISADGNGDVYITGSFYSSAISFGSLLLQNTGSADVFTVKYSADGEVMWARSAGGTQGQTGSDIAVTPDGNAYITGYFNVGISFGPLSIDASAGGLDLYIAKYNPTGEVQWVRSVGGIDYEEGLCISTTPNGNVWVGGTFASPELMVGDTTLVNAGNFGSDLLLLNYDPEGNLLWVISGGSADFDVIWCISTDLNGNLLITGTFNGLTISLGDLLLINSGHEEGFIAKLYTTETASYSLDLKPLTAFPNPTDGVWFLQDIEPGNWHLQAFTSSGQLIFRTEISGGQAEIDLSHLPAGMYTYLLYQDGGVIHTGNILLK